jgi:GTP cyclohydrolase I
LSAIDTAVHTKHSLRNKNMTHKSQLPPVAHTLEGYIVAPEIDETLETPIHSAVRDILLGVGEDPNRKGLLKTPDRVARMYAEITAGYHQDPEKLINGALFDVDYSEMVLVKDIEFYSMCEHHMLPFFGRAHVAYVPSHKVIGLSKIPRIVEMYARRLQVQERMTRQIAELIQQVLNPYGVSVVIEASHMCSMMRGVKKEHARMVTSSMLGCFKANEMTRNEFLHFIEAPRVAL